MKNKKDCFGSYEDNNNSWHCVGCAIANECREFYEVTKGKEKNMNANQIDNVNQPNHYKQHKFECIDEMVIMFGVEATINFCKCNAWKYRARAPYKGNAEEDNKKADWYLNKAKELQEGKLWQDQTKTPIT